MIKNIIFDFDGVILDSLPIRDFGFKEIFKNYDDSLIEKLLTYHRINGGLSRYVKIKYFFEEILDSKITKKDIDILANKFSDIMKKELTNKKYLITETVEFLKKSDEKYNFHIASGSDEYELKYLCNQLNIDKYFISIHGSPTAKNILVETILNKYHYNKNETILIGDSINDYEASKRNNIDFYGFNNLELKKYSTIYLNNYRVLEL